MVEENKERENLSEWQVVPSKNPAALTKMKPSASGSGGTYIFSDPDFRRVSAEQLKTMETKEIVDTIFSCLLVKRTIDVDQVNYIFDTLLSLEAKKYTDIVNVLEKQTVFGLHDIVNRKQVLGHLKFDAGSWYDGNTGGETNKNVRQSWLQLSNRILEIKGDAADPFTKAIVRESAKLSDKDYNSGLKLFEALERAHNEVSGVKPKPKQAPAKADKPRSFFKTLLGI